jgi:hypothetical protein
VPANRIADCRLDSTDSTRLDSIRLSHALALVEPNADGRGGLSWFLFALALYSCWCAAELALRSEPRDAMRSGRCHWTTLLAAACTGASPGYLVACQLLTLTLTRCRAVAVRRSRHSHRARSTEGRPRCEGGPARWCGLAVRCCLLLLCSAAAALCRTAGSGSWDRGERLSNHRTT